MCICGGPIAGRAFWLSAKTAGGPMAGGAVVGAVRFIAGGLVSTA